MKCELYNENFQNFKSYNIPKAQLIIADIPYNIGKNFYGSNPSPAHRLWCVGSKVRDSKYGMCRKKEGETENED